MKHKQTYIYSLRYDKKNSKKTFKQCSFHEFCLLPIPLTCKFTVHETIKQISNLCFVWPLNW